MAKAKPAEDTPNTPKVPIPVVDESAWDSADGQEFGGSADIMLIQPGQIAGPFEYQGHQQITTDLGETTVHLGADEDGNQWRLPIQATFIKAVDQSGMRRGDRFLVRRLANQTKKKGKGAGNEMAIYAVKVIERVAASAPANANQQPA